MACVSTINPKLKNSKLGHKTSSRHDLVKNWAELRQVPFNFSNKVRSFAVVQIKNKNV